MFDRLGDEWRIGLPEDEAGLEEYVEELIRVVKWLHFGAGMVHGDLMPCNVAWCKESSEKNIKIKLLDFDGAASMNSTHTPELMECINEECPSWPGRGRKADARIDSWFCYLYSLAVGHERTSYSTNEKNAASFVNYSFGSMRREVNVERFEEWHESQWKK